MILQLIIAIALEQDPLGREGAFWTRAMDEKEPLGREPLGREPLGQEPLIRELFV